MSTVATAFADFIQYLAAERGLASNTIEAYERDVARFIASLGKQPIMACSEITCDMIIAYIASMKIEEYASASISRALMAIKVFCRFLWREGYTSTDIALTLSSPKIWQLVPDILSTGEIELLLKATDPTTKEGCRDRAMLELLYSCGLRVSELCQLGLYDVGEENIRVRGKGGKERVVPIGKSAIDALDNYLVRFRGACSEKAPLLFVGKGGGKVNRVSVWHLVKRYARKAGVNKVISPHSLRHAYATHLLDNGADLRVIQELMGHAHIASTDRYMHLSRRQVQEAFVRCHPRDVVELPNAEQLSSQDASQR